jgi:hypothetical protein
MKVIPMRVNTQSDIEMELATALTTTAPVGKVPQAVDCALKTCAVTRCGGNSSWADLRCSYTLKRYGAQY